MLQSATNATLAAMGFRCVVGVNFLMHAAVRLGKLPSFAESIGNRFAETAVPVWAATAFAYSIPPLELLIGLALLAGTGVRWACVGGMTMMAALLFGSSHLGEWTLVGWQTV